MASMRSIVLLLLIGVRVLLGITYSESFVISHVCQRVSSVTTTAATNPVNDDDGDGRSTTATTTTTGGTAAVVLPEVDLILQVAIAAAKKAGDIILGNAGGAKVTERKANSRDLLTLIDPICEQTIKDTILASFPNHYFLGEEDVPPGKEASAAAIQQKLRDATDEWLWIVDPIDGTTNFVHGMPLCMPSIAATYNGQVMVGVIYDCHRDELFTAIAGRGAHLNGNKITVGSQATLGDAIVAMGSPPAMDSLQMSLKGIAALMPRVRTIRMLGSAALMLAWVANGRLTCYWEYDLSSWDISAGALLIQEAGGRFTDLEGRDFHLQTRKVCATNGYIHDELLHVLRHEAGIV